ncbi:MAG: hypothetical protein EBR02_01345 [Alphaproteobacteria bacterium]|nr:hypothetical protein [Alphaproteobacteria bacterium]
MHIFMLTTHRGSEDGFSLRLFEREEHYDVADTLARSFIARGWAVESRLIFVMPAKAGILN